jgi:integrase
VHKVHTGNDNPVIYRIHSSHTGFPTMGRSSQRQPSYRLHKGSGLAVCTLNGRDFYLGQYGTEESKAKYDALISEWLAGGRILPSTNGDLTVNEMLSAYLEYAEGYYVKNGRPTSQLNSVRQVIRTVRQPLGDTEANKFTPNMLEAVRTRFVDSGTLARPTVNRLVRLAVGMFRWAAAKGLISPSVWHGLLAYEKQFSLKKGRTTLREPDPVGPVERAHVDAIRSYVNAKMWAMIELQWHTGARPGEAVLVRTVDIDRTGDVWEFIPITHKTEHHDRQRRIYLGRSAQQILKPWLKPDDPTAFLFRGRKRRRQKRADHYSEVTYSGAINRAIKRCNADRAEKGLPPIPSWSPNQLRHAAATRIERALGTEDSRVVLGHVSPRTTDIYIQRDFDRARAAMAKLD